MIRTRAHNWLGILSGLLLLAIPFSGQTRLGSQRISPVDARPVDPNGGQIHSGYPQDWSSSHLLMPGLRVQDVPAAAAHDPRYVYNLVMRRMAEENAPVVSFRPRRRIKVDWAVSLENGFVPQNQFPAKYRFDAGGENCNSDYVIYGLTVNTGTQANLVGINNLYTEATPACNSGVPWVAFAYNTVTQLGGQIRTSPTLSTDGKKVAFVESTTLGTYFHVLVLPTTIPTPPASVGSVLVPQTPISCTTPTTANCMTTLTIETGSANTNSSPWVDYNSDIAYVGADNGLLYKISPVFGGGAPALVNDASNWPVTVSAATQTNTILTDPIVDVNSGRIFLGDGYGYVYAVNINNPGKTFVAKQTVGWVFDGTNDGSGGPGTGIVDSPIVVNDFANPATNQVFAFTGCSQVPGIGGAVTQLAANFTTGVPSATNTVDLGSGSGNGDCTSKNLHSGTFDNAFWLNGTTTGHMAACGFVQGSNKTPLIPSNPRMYFFPFASHVITSTGASGYVVDITKGDECSPLTEFFDGTTDRVFYGVGSASNGLVQSSTITTSLTTPVCSALPTSTCVTAPSALGGTSGVIIDNQVSNGGANIYFSTLAAGSVNSQKCNVTGGAANPFCAVKLTQSLFK